MNSPHATEKHWGEVNKSTWKEILAFVRDELPKLKRRWIYRGLSDYCYAPTSTLDRAFCAAAIVSEKRWEHEANMLYQFKRRSHHYLGTGHTPDPEDFLEWFSLMRHHGAPSRLLDFSNSFFVAIYFAVSTATLNDAAVLCVDHTWLEEQGTKRLVKSGEFFQDPPVFWKYAIPYPSGKRRKPFVVPVRPFRSNERIHVQQGLFLCPTDVGTTFIKNLKAVCPDPTEAAKYILKIRVRRAWHRDVRHDLREMNISSESLYPGISGFAASIRDLLYFEQPLVRGRLNGAIRKNPRF